MSGHVRSEWCQNGIATNSDVKYVRDDHELVRGIEANTHMIPCRHHGSSASTNKVWTLKRNIIRLTHYSDTHRNCKFN